MATALQLIKLQELEKLQRDAIEEERKAEAEKIRDTVYLNKQSAKLATVSFEQRVQEWMKNTTAPTAKR